MTVLVTGGAGYIGSHTVLELLHAGQEVVVLDNLSNSSRESLRRVERLSGRSLVFCHEDLLDEPGLDKIFRTHRIESVIHFAGLKAVGESVSHPLAYYRTNMTGTINLCSAMQRHGVQTLVFSSSATVYGDPKVVPIPEDADTGPTNPYGRTKLFIEDMLQDLYNSESGWRIAALRYFNPVGAHKSGDIGEDPGGPPNNLMPYIAQVAVGRRPQLGIFGDDYDTKDGTGVRDYIHVTDLAYGHVCALERLARGPGMLTYNLGTGHGHSVFEMLKEFERASGQTIPYEVQRRRPGDIASCYADVRRAEDELDWRATRSVEEMCADSWRWQSNNPNGYPETIQPGGLRIVAPPSFAPEKPCADPRIRIASRGDSNENIPTPDEKMTCQHAHQHRGPRC